MFTPSRLVLSRKYRGMTKVKLGLQARLTPKALGDFEAGRLMPSVSSVEAIALATRFPPTFYERPDIEEPSKDGVSFRALSKMTAGQRDAALAAGALAFELTDWIDRRFELPLPQLPDLRDFDPAEAAMMLRTSWGIGQRPIGNMVHLLESKGVRVFSLTDKSRRIDAYSLWYIELPFVFLNTRKTAERSRMDAAHELGHLVLHQHGVPRGRDAEKDAQVFAAAFLMPEGSVRATVPRLFSASVHQLAQLKLHWLVSVAALTHRLYRLNLLTEWNYREVFMQLSQYGRSSEMNGIERETSQVYAKVFGAKKNGGASKASVARQLDLYTEDVDSLIFGLSKFKVAGGGRYRTNAAADNIRSNFKVYTTKGIP